LENTVTLEGHEYSIGKINARVQWHIVRRILAGMKKSGLENPSPLDAFANISDADMDYITDACVLCCQRKTEVGGWADVAVRLPRDGGVQYMFQDMGMDTLTGLTTSVIEHNIASFTPSPLPQSAVVPTEVEVGSK
jgi:hypothetical protein